MWAKEYFDKNDIKLLGCSSACSQLGEPAWHAGGQRLDPAQVHQLYGILELSLLEKGLCFRNDYCMVNEMAL